MFSILRAFVQYPLLAASCTPLSTPASTLVPRCGLPLRTSLARLFPPPATLLDGTAEHTKAQVVEPLLLHRIRQGTGIPATLSLTISACRRSAASSDSRLFFNAR
jgi:hypothetical protein